MSKRRLRVLLVYRTDVDKNGGAASVMVHTCEALGDLGVEAEITYDRYPETSGFDLVHVFNIWSPPTALSQLKHLRLSGVPVVWSPFYLHWCECAWANLAFDRIYRQQGSPAEKEKMLNAFAAGTLEIDGFSQWKPNEIYCGFHRVLKEMLSCVDHLCLASRSEIQKLSQIAGDPHVGFTVTPHGVDSLPFRNASAGAFIDRFGVEDFALCVGAVDRRKNQLMLIEALKRADMPLVLIGPCYEQDYLEVCRREGGAKVIFTGRLSPELVASAYKAASVHVLPSFAEGAALANLEAAVSECAMVVSNRSSEFEYFGDRPFYCSPNDPASIARAVCLAGQSLSEKERWEKLASHVEINFTWKRTAELTLEAYERTLSGKSKSSPQPGRNGDEPPGSHQAGSGQRDRTLPVLWSGPIFNSSGYADQARNFIRHIGQNWPVYLRPAGAYDNGFVSGMDPVEYRMLAQRVKTPGSPYISLLSMPACAFQKDPDAAYNIGKTCFETDRLSPEWVTRCNEMDEIWVSTEFNVETFRRSGIKVPLVVIPEGVDPNFYRPGVQPLTIPGRRKFAFLSIFEWTYRKGWDLLLKAWAEAFQADEDVCLVLRSYPVQNCKENPRREIETRVHDYFRSLGCSIDRLAPVIVLKDHVPQRQMPELYASADAFVLPSRGEGWGRPYIEAMSSGLPVIGTRWSSQLAFMDDENSYLIDTCGLEQIDEKMELPFYKGHLWSAPSVDHLVSLMKHVFSNPETARLKGQKARQEVISRWTWKSSADQALARIREISIGLGTGRGWKPVLQGGDGTLGVPVFNPETESRLEACAPTLQGFRIRWEGSQFVGHSLALVNRELCLQLIDSGCELSIIPGNEQEDINPDADTRFGKIVQRTRRALSAKADVHVRHHWPPGFDPPEEGRWVIIQPWEYGRLPESWVVPMANLVDEIWVPSRHVLKTCIASGIPAERVHVVPNGVNTDQFHPGAPKAPLDSSKKFRFLFVGGGLWRKGVDILVDAYRSAFSSRDDVVLIIKDLPQRKIYIDQGLGRIIRQIQSDPHAPEILHLQATLGPDEMPGLYAACDCLVHPYRAEGFALPVLEAMACGVPVITSAGGSTDDFCSPDEAFLVPAVRREFNPRDVRLAGGSGWVLEPDANVLAELLTYVHAHPEEAAQRAQRALERATTQYTWKAAADRVLDRVRALQSRLAHRR